MAETIGLRAILDLSGFNKGLSSYNKGIGEMSKGTSNFASTAGRQLGDLGSSLLKVGAVAGGAALAGVTALAGGLAAFAVSGISQAKDLDQQMANIAAVMGKTKDEVGPLKDLILELSINPNLKVSATEAADAVELLARNGVSATDILGGMAEQTVALANATGADFGTAADLATDVMALFSEQGVTMQQAVDGITGVTVNSKFTVNDYADAMANLGGAASGLGLDFGQINALLAATASTFKGGAEAGTALRNIFLRLSDPTSEAAQLMEQYGISMFDAQGNMRDIGEIATDLNRTLQGQATITQTVGGVTEEMANAAESASKKLPALNNTIEEQQAKLAILENELGAVTDMYGQGSPAVEKHKVKILTLSNSLEENIAKQQELEGALSAVQNAHAETITTTKQLTDEEKAHIESALGGTKAVSALVAISKIQGSEFDTLTDKVNEEGQAMRAAATRVDSLQGAMEIFKSIIQGVQIQVGDKFLPIIKDMLVSFTDIASKQGPKVIAFFGKIADFISGTAVPAITNFVNKIKGLITTFQAGGLFGSRSGSFGSEGLLSALGIPPDAVAIIQDIFNTIKEVIAGFQEGGVGGAFGALFSSESAGSALQGVIDFITQFLADNWPLVQEQLNQWGSMFFDWVAQLYPKIPEVLTGVVQSITDWLSQNWPAISETLSEWSTMFWDWAKDAATGAAAALAGIGVALLAWASSSDAQTSTQQLGEQIGQMIFDALGLSAQNTEGSTSVLTTLATGLLTAAASVVGTLITLGAELVAGILSGILSEMGANLQPTTISELGATLSGIATNALTAAKLIGENIITGITDGIAGFQQALETKMIEIATSAIDAVKSVLGISSPSTVFYEFGTNLIQGLIDGAESLIGSLSEVAGSIFNALLGGGGDTGEVAAPTMPTLPVIDSDAMAAGIQAVTTATEALNTSINNISLVTIPLLTETFTVLTTMMLTQLIAVLTTGVMPLDLAMVTMTTVTLPTLQQAFITTGLIAVNALIPLQDILNVLIALMQTLTRLTVEFAEAAVKAGEEAAKGFEKAAEAIESKLVKALEKADSAAESLRSALQGATQAAGGLGGALKSEAGLGFSQGMGFQAGIGANTSGLLGLGYRVPPGFPNDSFGPFFAQSGEEMLITPKGTSIEGLIFSRLANLLRGTSVQGGGITNNNIQNNFNLQVQTTSSAQGTIRQFNVMRGFVGT